MTGLALVLGLYGATILATPLLHHDLACHQKSPTHCQACTASPLASRIERGVVPAAAPLRDAGSVASHRAGCAPMAPCRTARDRAPPVPVASA
jgi:hypothetical protein